MQSIHQRWIHERKSMYRIKEKKALVLASGSPRRSEMLRGLGLDFEVVVPQIDEQISADEPPSGVVMRLALEKAEVVANRRQAAWVLAADTIVVLDQVILGKPKDWQDAQLMLTQLSDRWHLVVGAVVLLNREHNYCETFVDITEVKVVSLSQQQVVSYCNSGEPFDKAGAYAIQGLAGHFIERMVGSYTNVVGLNLARVVSLLFQAELLEVRGGQFSRSSGGH
jgi:septum formation protein